MLQHNNQFTHLVTNGSCLEGPPQCMGVAVFHQQGNTTLLVDLAAAFRLTQSIGASYQPYKLQFSTWPGRFCQPYQNASSGFTLRDYQSKNLPIPEVHTTTVQTLWHSQTKAATSVGSCARKSRNDLEPELKRWFHRWFPRSSAAQ